MFFMWLPLTIPKSIILKMLNWTFRIFKVFVSYFIMVWTLIFGISSKAAEYVEKVPLFGKYLAWILNLPLRLNLTNVLELMLSLIKNRPNPEVNQ